MPGNPSSSGKTTRILGVDPGSRFTGYGCVDRIGNQIRPVTQGTLKLLDSLLDPKEKAGVTTSSSFADRLLLLYEGLSAVIQRFRPEILVVEKVFFAKNAVSALKLGQARGVVILTGKIHGLSFVEYSSTEVKRAIAGHGHAEKEQVAKILQLLLGPQEFETADASDGLALALCHAQLFENAARFSDGATSLRSEQKQRTNKKKLTLAESLGFQSPKKF